MMYAAERAAEMTASCTDVDFDRAKDGTVVWHAIKWCNYIGNYVVGVGGTAWAAVQDAHRRVDEQTPKDDE